MILFLKETRLLLDSGQILIYNYNYNVWTSTKDKNLQSLEVLNSKTILLTQQGGLFTLDEEGPNDFLFKTGSLLLRNIMDFQRLYRIRIKWKLLRI